MIKPTTLLEYQIEIRRLNDLILQEIQAIEAYRAKRDILEKEYLALVKSEVKQ